jgi:uncharacterized membrane protein
VSKNPFGELNMGHFFTPRINGNPLRRRSPIVNIALSAIMAALVTVTTYAVQVPVPATNGYINIGDAVIFTSSLAFGPIVGGIAGGLGSFLSDALGGYWQFAPITLIVKGLEGLAAGLLANGRSTKRDFIAVLFGGVIMVLGYFLAETYLLGYGAAAAFVELPGNIFQIVAGGLIGVPASMAVRRYVGSVR